MARSRRGNGDSSIQVGVERGGEGFRGVWALDLPGCYALVPPGADPVERLALAIVEFTAWAHNRAADRATVDIADLQVVQVVDTGANVRSGETAAFFIHDREAPGPREFPLWANPHDLALDELRDAALSLPAALGDELVDSRGQSLLRVVEHCAATERFYAEQLRFTPSPPASRTLGRPARDLQDAHAWLQQVVCAVPPDLSVKQPAGSAGRTQEWSARRVMRQSICHLRYHTWDLRRAVSGIWLE